VDAGVLRTALEALDARLDREVRLLVGGGAALALAHGLRVTTLDVDAVPFRCAATLEDLAPIVAQVGAELGIGPTWLNGYFSTFLHVLPADYGDRLVPIVAGKRLTALALGAEDLVVMKLFAGRDKDLPHARALLVKGADASIIDAHLQTLIERGIPGAQDAADRLDELRDQLGR